MSVVNGHVINGTPICVDYWLWTQNGKYNYFLTHLHADHTVNLKSTFRGTIYTSPFNCWLLRRWFNINPEQIEALTVGDSHLVFDEESQTRFSVTPLDANHCPGSVMFLFQGQFGNILYTGDFRYCDKILDHPMLKSLIENEAVDRLYLDNTFAAEHCEFPPRHEALKSVIELIKKHPDHTILLGLRKLGKEEVLRAIALELKEKICVSEEKLRILTKLGYPNVFTTHSEDSRIHVTEIPRINLQFINQLRTDKGPVITILLTALYSVIPPEAKISSMATDIANGIYKIPYSDHSCHSELVEFVSKIKPKEIFPIVSSFPKNVNSRIKDDLSEMCTWQNSVIPKSILKYCRNGTLEDSIPLVTLCKMNLSSNRTEVDVISYMTDDISETSFKSITKGSKIIPTVKGKEEGESRNQIIKSKVEAKVANGSKELISRRNKTPSPSEPVLSDHLSEEYFTLSDEELLQNCVTQDQPIFSDKPKKSKEVSESSYNGVCKVRNSFITEDEFSFKFVEHSTPVPKSKGLTKKDADKENESCVSRVLGEGNKTNINYRKFTIDETNLNNEENHNQPQSTGCVTDTHEDMIVNSSSNIHLNSSSSTLKIGPSERVNHHLQHNLRHIQADVHKKCKTNIESDCEHVDDLGRKQNEDRSFVGDPVTNRPHSSQPCKQFSEETKENVICSQNKINNQHLCEAKKKILVEKHVLEQFKRIKTLTESELIHVSNVALKESDNIHNVRQQIGSDTCKRNDAVKLSTVQKKSEDSYDKLFYYTLFNNPEFLSSWKESVRKRELEREMMVDIEDEDEGMDEGKDKD